MSKVIIYGVLGAIGTGVVVTLQAAIGSRSGLVIGPIRTGMWMYILGGIIATLLLVFGFGGKEITWEITRPYVGWLALGGLMGITILTGISFSLARIGVLAGLTTVILGQLGISVIADAQGWGGAEPIPFTWERALGLVVVAAGVFLLLPKE